MNFFDWKTGIVTMAMGSGGKLSAQLIEELFLPAYKNKILAQLNDQASIPVNKGRIAVSTDSHVITPLFFPGGDIGSLAVHGTVNDVAMAGATPLYMTIGMILEEGLPLKDLKQIVASIAAAAKEAGIGIVSGDTKVVEKGHGDGLYINTTGIGIIPEGVNFSANSLKPGDKIILSGSIGDHSAAIMCKRESLSFGNSLSSDTQSLNDLVATMLNVTHNIRCLRDPTRGGIGITLNEFAQQSKVGITLEEAAIPIKEQVMAVCEILGLDPLYLANEGKLLCICPPDEAAKLLSAMKGHPKGKDAAIIGEVVVDKDCFVQMKTMIGGYRFVDYLTAEQLPRIC